jgi:UDP-N-acetylenolpyruvoylglucosamine reductase
MMSATEIMTPMEMNLGEGITALLSPTAILRRDEPMARHTTLRVGGPADVYVEPAAEDELAAILKYCQVGRHPFFIIGRGSNLLVRDAGFRGVVICLAQPAFSRIEVLGEKLRVGAGARLKQVAVEARRNGLSGLEFFEGIPGSLGGALRMNAGAMAQATFDAVESVRFMTYGGEVRELPGNDLEVEYRSCATLKRNVALGAVLRGQLDSVESIAQRMSAFNQKRWTTQPAAPSAGCAFKNPPSQAAGRLIDELGLKGTRVGGAVVSQEHGNFIINDGGATAADVLALIALLQARVKAACGIELHTEVEIIGEAAA